MSDNQPSAPHAPQFHPRPAIRASRLSDRDAILEFMRGTGMFRPDEIDIAAEVLDDALAAGPAGHYQSYTAELFGRIVGWVCFGPTPCTVGTYDIYWIAVDQSMQGKGIGKALMTHSEQLIRQLGGRLAIVETNGREEYNPTRQFYLRCGYTLAARVQDFYSIGDDKVIFTKVLTS